jgi:hypothetical protein
MREEIRQQLLLRKWQLPEIMAAIDTYREAQRTLDLDAHIEAVRGMRRYQETDGDYNYFIDTHNAALQKVIDYLTQLKNEA